jgi:hypothetical protein
MRGSGTAASVSERCLEIQGTKYRDALADSQGGFRAGVAGNNVSSGRMRRTRLRGIR